ncbi:VOC family protein [Pedobacter sp.]|uniref:VOC family protein n=1 Tax=Pedobacter sp. TaxID=1411316 RepID=UPI00396CB71D
MTTILPFIRVRDVGYAKSWYESIGFSCVGTHEEPDCGLDWAMMCWGDAMFMLYPLLENTIENANNCGLYFKMESIAGLQEKLEGKANIIEIVSETEYGRKEITFHDCYGFQVTFSSEPD